uniref:Ubiquitin-like protease family profile domain-containing protein n=1 Tax=Brassica oleracea var. oleracea TaxID=109376 RepID=A0A0D2ZUR9_BRAOL
MELERFENYPWGRVAFKVWVYTALPELGANYGNPLPNNPSPPILAYKGRKGRRKFKEVILNQTRVINFVQKDIGEMFPKWEFDVEDPLAENIIKLMFDIVYAMKEEFGTCFKEIKYLSERVEAVEKKVGITTKRKGTSAQNTTPRPKPTLEPEHIDAWINVLRKSYDANPQHFRSKRMCFLDHLFTQQWRFNYKDFKDSEPDQNGLGRRLPGGAWNYYAGTIPSFCQSNKISIPKMHIVIWDSICSSISPEELDVVMEHFLYMVPYLLVECASSDEQCAQYSLEPFTYERPTNIPPARAGDCGVYSLKYIECHALGIEFSKKDFAKPNEKTMKDKMVVNIFQELPDAHEFENKDNDANLGAYEG